MPLLHTQGADFLRVMQHPRAGVATNKFLRILHNRAKDMGWLLNPVLSPRAWPKFKYGNKRAITEAEHHRILEVEKDPEHRLYYEMIWETGGSQSDVANLHWENVDLGHRRLYYDRMKLAGRNCSGAALAIGPTLEALLEKMPRQGWLFPEIRIKTVINRATRFQKRCKALKIDGVTLHSYRYAWAERAKTAGMPEREAMGHLGHNSRAIHQAYAKQANVVTMPLEYYEKIHANKIIEFEKLAAGCVPANDAKPPELHGKAIPCLLKTG